jgi:3-hydroxybutyryl-CoA dehydrogenase
MQVIVLDSANRLHKWLPGGTDASIIIHVITDIQQIPVYAGADAVIDLDFEPVQERVQLLSSFLPRPIIINSVIHTLSETNPSFIRFNGWPTFLERSITEAVATSDETKLQAEKIFQALKKKTEWVPDMPGFITARVISMIINEAYFALDEKVSTKEEIDIAMKTGTNYPFGPFEWGKLVGLKNIVSLLDKLSCNRERYLPAALLQEEAQTI